MWFISLLCVAGAVVAQKYRFDNPQVAFHAKNQSTDLAKMQLSSVVDEAAFTTLIHPNFPTYQVRVKKTAFCDPTVK